MGKIIFSNPSIWIENKPMTIHRSTQKPVRSWDDVVGELSKCAKRHALTSLTVHSNYVSGKDYGEDRSIAVSYIKKNVTYVFCCDEYYSPTLNLREIVNTINNYWTLLKTKVHYVKIKKDGE